jgi:hypothetical protein
MLSLCHHVSTRLVAYGFLKVPLELTYAYITTGQRTNAVVLMGKDVCRLYRRFRVRTPLASQPYLLICHQFYFLSPVPSSINATLVILLI